MKEKKETIITFRCSRTDKKEWILLSEKLDMNLSEFIQDAIQEYRKTKEISEKGETMTRPTYCVQTNEGAMDSIEEKVIMMAKYIKVKVLPWYEERPGEAIDEYRPDGYEVKVYDHYGGKEEKNLIYHQRFHTNKKGNTVPIKRDEAISIARNIMENPYKYLHMVIQKKELPKKERRTL